MKKLILLFLVAITASAQPYQVNPSGMTRTRIREAWSIVNSNTVYFAENLGGGAVASLWELDSNGDLQPNTETAAAGGWELDGNGDLQPSI